MADEQTPPMGLSKGITFALIAAAIVVLSAAGYGLYRFSLYFDGKGDALALSVMVLVGLALVIALMAGLTIVYSILGVANKLQPLALPEGSVRALISFSLLLIFVCLATLVYSGAEGETMVQVGKVTRATTAQIAALERVFTVAVEPARKADGTLDTDVSGGTTTPLYNATYYSLDRRKEADDIGKQVFTTLATVFVSVVSFYFGSSTTASAVGTGMKAAGGDAGGRSKPQE
jgi:hypothetical protein